MRWRLAQFPSIRGCLMNIPTGQAESRCERIPVSAIILTYNEQVNIETCLRSVQGWCQDIFVVDSGSTDDTLALCRRYTERIYTHAYVDHASQWIWSLNELPIPCDWVIPLDADHVVTEELRRQMMDAVLKPDTIVNGYFARHEYYFWGKRMRGFKPHSMRLFRRSRTHVDRSELVDYRFVVSGKTKNLSGILRESNRKEDSIDFWIDKHQKFSSNVAVEEILRRSGDLAWSLTPRLWGNPDERIIWLKNCWYEMPLYIRPFLYFLYRYIVRLGFLDGTNGLVYHFLQAFWFRLLVDIKIAEIRRRLAMGQVSLEQLNASIRG